MIKLNLKFLISKILTSLFFCVACLSHAGEWTQSGKVTQIYPKPSRDGVYIKHEFMLSNGCSNNSFLFLYANQSLYKEIYTLLVASYHSSKNVRIFLEGCQTGANYPLIKEVIAD